MFHKGKRIKKLLSSFRKVFTFSNEVIFRKILSFMDGDAESLNDFNYMQSVKLRYVFQYKYLKKLHYSRVLETDPSDGISAACFLAAANRACEYTSILTRNCGLDFLQTLRSGFKRADVHFTICQPSEVLNQSKQKFDLLSLNWQAHNRIVTQMLSYAIENGADVLIRDFNYNIEVSASGELKRIVNDCRQRLGDILLRSLDDKTVFLEYIRNCPEHPWPVFIKSSTAKLDRYPYYNGNTYRSLVLGCETVNYCNNRCLICPYPLLKNPPKVMSMKLFEEIVTQYADLGGGSFGLVPRVGEILLDKFLPERIACIRKFPNIGPLSTTTNAVSSSLFSDTELKYIISQFDSIDISVYGLDRDEHGMLAGADHYERFIECLQRILMLLEGNTGKLTFNFRTLKNHVASRFSEWLEENTHCSSIPYSHIYRYANWGNLSTHNSLPFDASWLPERENSTPCHLPTIVSTFMVNGDLSACSCANYGSHPDLMLGNIQDTTLMEMFQSRKLKKILGGDGVLPEFCKRCTFQSSLYELDLCALMFGRVN